jgi:beta-galactosidase
MKNIVSGRYFPFGSQYYRAPSPRPEDWERDTEQFARLGLNTIKYWVQWRWNNPAEDTYYFEDIDRLMDLAEKNNLRVMLNTIFDVAPVWIFHKYPDASMVTLNGRTIGPQTQPHRQIGGLGYCFNHDGVMEYFFKFLEATIHRYKEHPALEIWNVGSEPELTSSMSEMRLYADNAEKMGDMLCYCTNCIRKFKTWLSIKYGSIEALNHSWNRNYSSFDQVEVPKTRNTFNDIIDWRMFFVDTLGDNVRRRFELAKKIDEGKHPLMCHHVFIQGFPVVSTANDPWNVGRFGDLHGFTQMDDPMMCDILRSCARGKPVISAEMLMLMGYTLDLPEPIYVDDIKRNIFTGIAANLKGFIFWQYRPEILGREAPTWGLTYPDGTKSPWLEEFSAVGRTLQQYTDFLLDASPAPAEIALLYNPENQIFAWAATGNEKNATDSLLGVHKALYERNYTIDFIHPTEFGSGLLKKYKVLVVPFPYVLNKDIASEIEIFVREGGVVIGESYFAGWDLENGAHHTTVPGYGLHNVFGVRQSIVAPAGMNDSVEIELKNDLPGIPKWKKIRGMMVKETFFTDRAEILASYADGTPAITCASYGKGKAVLIGSYVGLQYFRTGHVANADCIAALIAYTSDVQRPKVTGGTKVRIDYLTNSSGNMMLIARNIEQSSVSVKIILPDLKAGIMREIFSGEELETTEGEEGTEGTVMLRKGEVKVYYA